MREHSSPHKLTAAMIQIAQNPNDPWLAPYIKEHNVPAKSNRYFSDNELSETLFDAQDGLIKHLSSKLKVND